MSIIQIRRAFKEYKNRISPRDHNMDTDLIAMCQEMRGTLNSIALSSSIITHFEFTVSGWGVDLEPARFNEDLIEHKDHARHVEDQLNALRGRCSIIDNHVRSLEKTAQRRGFSSLTELLGLSSQERKQQLTTALQRIYHSEILFHHNVYEIKIAPEKALAAVEDELGPPGMMYPANVPKAAAILGECAKEFRKSESNADYSALQLQELINDLKQ
ncbi:MAG: hypothetical protein JO272_15875 [Pseudonocardiales bacterium]|nr:hypothetical protein [Pseudonocardiales bacterium]